MTDKSIWLDNIKRDKYLKLSNDVECDILIIGGGITGICTAYFLRNSNNKIILVEGNKIGTGATAKSTGKLTYLQEDNLNKIKSIYNENIALKYLNSQKDAIELAENIILDNNINCDLQKVSSYIFTKKNGNVNKITKTHAIIKNETTCELQEKIPIKVKCIKALKGNNTYVFHPTKFVLGIAKKIKDKIDIYEDTRIISLERKKNIWLAKTPNNLIKAKTVVLACHYPFFIVPYLFPFKTTIEKSYLVASKVDKIKSFSAINVESPVLSFRYYSTNNNNYFIMCSETNDLGKNINDLEKRNKIMNKMKYNFSANITHCWSNHDIMTTDHIPVIGKIDNHLYLSTGYNTWGMTNGILGGKIISDIILRRKNKYISLFNPLRNLKSISTLINYNVKNSVSFIDTKLNKKRNFYTNDVKVFKENGIWYGSYRDENGIEHKVLNKCPHMKCNLSFNYQNKSWDCPCHGSSFDIDGNVIYGPSTYNIKINKKND